MHDAGEVSQWSFEGEVIMVRHQAINVDNGGPPLLGIPERLKEIETVMCLAMKNSPPPFAFSSISWDGREGPEFSGVAREL
jgi:hypothetical protein